jgi:hypothetical protein
MKVCNVHKVEFVHKTGLKTDGSAYDFWSCPMKNADGNWCKDKGIEKGNFESAKAFEKSVENTKASSFSMNNAVALINGGKVELEDLEKCYDRILGILEK